MCPPPQESPPLKNPIYIYIYPGIPTTIKIMGVNITTIAYLRVLIIDIGSTIILMVVEAQGIHMIYFFGVLEAQATRC